MKLTCYLIFYEFEVFVRVAGVIIKRFVDKFAVLELTVEWCSFGDSKIALRDPGELPSLHGPINNNFNFNLINYLEFSVYIFLQGSNLF